ncbi:MAG: biotin/lipoyl-binding protein, partial [Firmicutes bacterium]|nr:biotin/lipoyl-binding protein [Bacillota bacterium]
MENQQMETPKKKTGTKIFIVVVIVAVLALLGFRIWESLQPVPVEEEPPVNVRVATVELGSLSVTSPLNGRIAAENEAMVIPMASGEVTAVHVALGDYVEKDAVLFEIDPTQMQSTYNQAAAGLSQAQAGVSQAKLARDNAKRDYERMADLYAAGA